MNHSPFASTIPAFRAFEKSLHHSNSTTLSVYSHNISCTSGFLLVSTKINSLGICSIMGFKESRHLLIVSNLLDANKEIDSLIGFIALSSMILYWFFASLFSNLSYKSVLYYYEKRKSNSALPSKIQLINLGLAL